jgi:uncharacterized tellurite resistance protein B-like protein
MMRNLLVIASACLLSTAALADGKPSDAEAASIKTALSAWGCDGGTYEKETEASGVFEIDDAKCKDGAQYDFKLDKDFKVIVMTRD